MDVKHVLIVEDDTILAGMYARILQNHGYRTTHAATGEDGLRLSLQHHPDAILLDIQLPKMDGMTVMQKLRSDPWGRTAKIIILTNTPADDRLLGGVVRDEPSYYLVKAENKPDEVLEKIQEIVGVTSSE